MAIGHIGLCGHLWLFISVECLGLNCDFCNASDMYSGRKFRATRIQFARFPIHAVVLMAHKWFVAATVDQQENTGPQDLKLTFCVYLYIVDIDVDV